MEKGKTYRPYQTITREAAFARGFDGKWIHGDYDYRRARQLLGDRPTVSAVDFCLPSHNECRTRYIPTRDTMIYVKASSGQYGKPARVRAIE